MNGRCDILLNFERFSFFSARKYNWKEIGFSAFYLLHFILQKILNIHYKEVNKILSLCFHIGNIENFWKVSAIIFFLLRDIIGYYWFFMQKNPYIIFHDINQHKWNKDRSSWQVTDLIKTWIIMLPYILIN